METFAYILILGIDTTPEGNIKLFAQVGLPSLDPTGGEGPVFQTIKAEGHDITEALDNMYLHSTKRPNLNHLRLIIFTEKHAREGIYGVLDFLRRDTSVRLNIKVAVTTDDLEELLAVEEPLSTQPALAIISQFDFNAERSSVVRIELMDLVSNLVEPDREVVMPIIEAGEDRFTLGKTAVFRGDKLVTFLDKRQTFGLLLWQDQVRSGVTTVSKPGGDNVVSYNIISSKTEIKTQWNDNKLHVQVVVNTVLDLNEIRGQDQDDLENLANTYLINQMKDSLDIAKENGIDFLGLAVRFRRADPKAWSSVQSKWNEILRDAEYDLRGLVKIRGQGQIR